MPPKQILCMPEPTLSARKVVQAQIFTLIIWEEICMKLVLLSSLSISMLVQPSRKLSSTLWSGASPFPPPVPLTLSVGIFQQKFSNARDNRLRLIYSH
jgi:hypothetical protein